ncbi:MAG TPA: 2Fe-2S iron-sulfur cluster binding domain-containing protein [Bacteroidetes bacterium]|nr:2Fe-2S iron-sulfur cluster binding domain-containing protein [Bacteroidota bacterium]
MPKLIIDGREVEAPQGVTVLWAARKAGVEIPTFCYYPWFPPQGNCRICLVEVEGMGKLQIACNTPIRDGMVVHTNNERVFKARRGVMEFLLIHHPLDCPICDQAGECELQDYGYKYGFPVGRYRHQKRTYPKTDYGDKIAKEMNRCIHCRRCIRLSEDYLGVHHIGALNRGDRMEIGSYIEAAVPSGWAGNLIDVCPVGALTDKKMRFSARVWDLEHVPAYRPDCVHGCKVMLGLHHGKIYRVTARMDEHRVMKSLICDECRFEHYDLEDWVIEEDDVYTPLEQKIMKVPEPENA